LKPRFKRTGLFFVAAVVVLLAGSLGAFRGSAAAALYTGFGLQPEAKKISIDLGFWLGVGVSVGVALLWSAAMVKCSAEWVERTVHRARGVVGTGVFFGILAGIASTLVLHLGLQIAADIFRPEGLLLGFGVGISAHLLLGLLGGLLWLAALPKVPPSEA
jgi:hypothetical protein